MAHTHRKDVRATEKLLSLLIAAPSCGQQTCPKAGPGDSHPNPAMSCLSFPHGALPRPVLRSLVYLQNLKRREHSGSPATNLTGSAHFPQLATCFLEGTPAPSSKAHQGAQDVRAHMQPPATLGASAPPAAARGRRPMPTSHARPPQPSSPSAPHAPHRAWRPLSTHLCPQTPAAPACPALAPPEPGGPHLLPHITPATPRTWRPLPTFTQAPSSPPPATYTLPVLQCSRVTFTLPKVFLSFLLPSVIC